MRITANQVTLLRLFLLPLPVAMTYRGSEAWVLGALVVFTLLGLTDAVDGMLARRHGATPLGALLDPMVDKIFLAATYPVLADLRIVPLPLVAVLFVRELGVTALRSTALEEGVHFRTTRIAKLKTTVQMAGAGFILLIWLFPADRVILPVLAVALAAAAVPALINVLRRRTHGWMSISALVLVGTLALDRYLLAPPRAIQVILLVVLALTLISGAEYAWSMRTVLAGRYRRAPIEAVRLLALSLAVPLTFLPALERDGAPTVAVLAVLAAELAAGGLDNSIVQAGVSRGPWPDIIRSAAQAVLGALVLAALGTPSAATLAHAAAWLAFLVTLADIVRRSLRHRDIFFAAASPPAPTR